jgi:hypothetical protein
MGLLHFWAFHCRYLCQGENRKWFSSLRQDRRVSEPEFYEELADATVLADNDYDKRFYDPQVDRLISTDHRADTFVNLTPY